MMWCLTPRVCSQLLDQRHLKGPEPIGHNGIPNPDHVIWQVIKVSEALQRCAQSRIALSQRSLCLQEPRIHGEMP
eukprot:2343923-Prymnesium_polylepis.2